MRDTPESLPYGEHLPAVYRYAFLMTASAPAAGEVLRRTVEHAARGLLGDVRNPCHARRWLFAEARALCRRPLTIAAAVPALQPVQAPGATEGTDAPAADPLPMSVPAEGNAGDPAERLANVYSQLPEPERNAMVLFYLHLFDPGELAELLEIKPADLGALLTRGRALLQRQRAVCESLFAAA